MKSRLLVYHPASRADLARAWLLVEQSDGEELADRLLARLETFCLGLAEFAEVGTRHNDRYHGLRSVGVPGMKTATVLFLVQGETVTVLRVGYLGQNVWRDIPDPANDN